MVAEIAFLSEYKSRRTLPTHGHVRASVTFLADYRARRVEASLTITLDPLVLARSWFDFWAGAR